MCKLANHCRWKLQLPSEINAWACDIVLVPNKRLHINLVVDAEEQARRYIHIHLAPNLSSKYIFIDLMTAHGRFFQTFKKTESEMPIPHSPRK